MGQGAENLFSYWIIVGIVLVILIGLYIWLFLFARKRQKNFDAQYMSMKERHEVFVLNKKRVRERPKSGWAKFVPVKTYQVTGKISVSQSVRGMQMSRMQTVTFQTNKEEYEKIQVNHKYKMDIAGNYIGNVLAPAPAKLTKKEKPKEKAADKKAKRTTNGEKRKSK